MPLKESAAAREDMSATMDLQSPHQHQQSDKTKTKPYHIVPQDDTWMGLQEPLSSSASNSEDSQSGRHTRSKRTRLATSRIARDKLMRVMEDLILKEAELASAYELFDYTRTKSVADHEEIVEKLSEYEALLVGAQRKEMEMRRDGGVESVLKTQHERERWEHTKQMVQATLPEMLQQLEESIELNAAKLRHIQDKMEEIRAQRLSVREEIAEREEDIALALAAAD